MAPQPDSSKYLDTVVVVFVCAAFIFLSPFLFVWTLSGAPWYLPYLLWMGVIFLTALAQRLRRRHEL